MRRFHPRSPGLTFQRLASASLGLAAGLCLLASSCKERSHPPGLDSSGGASGGSMGIDVGTGGSSEPSSAPPENLSGLCGNQILPILQKRPNLYLVLDRSGSMSDVLEANDASKTTKYEASVHAIHDVLFTMGHRFAYGAALFPERGNTEDCSAGRSVDDMRAGDSVTYARNGQDGPHLAALMKVLNGYLPEGATPTSATLEALMPMLLGLEGDTAVILTTDGAPNCNGNARCEASGCIANIEGAFRYNGDRCDATVNCCTAADYGPYSCIDDAATIASLDVLLSRGIKTYVVGLPGTDTYTSVMNRMARAGGTAREPTYPSDPEYYRIGDSEALVTALKTITSGLSISCTVSLDASVPDWSKVNVYFDNGIVRMDEEDGWQRMDERTLELKGKSCASLKSGDVFQVQIVSGCPTETLQ
jgi:hypothetical protein